MVLVFAHCSMLQCLAMQSSSTCKPSLLLGSNTTLGTMASHSLCCSNSSRWKHDNLLSGSGQSVLTLQARQAGYSRRSRQQTGTWP